MASIADLEDSLLQADAAGDKESAQILADAIRQARGVTQDKPPSLGRQVGLLARHGIEGLADTAQIVTEPIRYFQDMLTPDRDKKLSDLVTGNQRLPKSKPLGVVAREFTDYLGLPTPNNYQERIVGDATRLMAGSGGILKAGAALTKLPGMVGELGTTLSQAPASQLASAAGSGYAGGASREAGDSAGYQLLSAVAGGLGGAGAAAGAGALANKANAVKNALMSPKQFDVKISGILQRVGVDYSQVPERLRQSLRADLADALATGREVDPAAVRRLLDFRANNLTPTRGSVSLDPVQITREQNLAKIAANSADTELHGLPRIQNQNNARLIQKLNDAGAREGNLSAAGNLVTGSVVGRQTALRNAEQEAWTAAKNSPGYRQPISSQAISDINAALGDEGLMPFMNPAISRYMEAFQTGQPFTPQAYRNLQSMLAREVSKGGNEGAAASLAQRILMRSDLAPAGLESNGAALVAPRMASAMRSVDGAADESIAAVNAARGATRQAYQYEDSSPLVRSVLSDSATSDPQRIAQRYVIGGTRREAEDLLQQIGPQGRDTIKNALVEHLKTKALNSSADEVGKFSQSAFNKALRQLEESGKLDLFFTRAEVEQLQSLGRAASYMQVQPVGSAVNNSSSGALMVGKALDFLRQVPVIGPMTVPALENMSLNVRQSQAQNIAPSLLLKQQPRGLLEQFLAPGIAAGGLLAAPGSN